MTESGVDGGEADAPVAAPPAGEQPPIATEVAPPSRAQRGPSMPKSPITRAQADRIGRVAVRTATGIGGFVAYLARRGTRILVHCWRAIDAMPASLKVLLVAGPLLLVGLVGAIALDNALSLICTVVIVPGCAMALGALGHRWYLGVADPRHADTAEPAPSDLQRCVEYVDGKLTVALKSFGAEHQQQTVIALVQAKTAVELTLGSETDDAGYGLPLGDDDPIPRPRIRLGSSTKSLPQQGNSLAAS